MLGEAVRRERGRQKSYVVSIFENVIFVEVYLKMPIDITTPGICCVKGGLKQTLLALSRARKGWGH